MEEQIQIEANEPTTEETQRPATVKFTNEQQEKVNLLIREAMGRAAREVRAEAARLKAELEATTAELQTARGTAADAQATKERGMNLGKEGLLLSLAAKHGFVKGEQLTKLIGDCVAFDESTKKYVVKNPDGSTATAAAADGSPLAVEALVSAFASENPHLVRGEVKPGVGSTESRAWSGEPTVDLKQLFGRGSNAKLANDLAMNNPNEYRRLRALAQRQGLIR